VVWLEGSGDASFYRLHGERRCRGRSMVAVASRGCNGVGEGVVAINEPGRTQW
jgi:hypothetical protein